MANLSDWRVLVIEDEPDVQSVVTIILQNSNAEVDAYETGEDALAALQNGDYTLAIVDLALPAMDGWEVLRNIRDNPQHDNMAVVAMTAYHSTNVALESQVAGFAAYFPKPINVRSFVDDLVAVVN